MPKIGVGTELKRTLRRYGYLPTLGCNCDSLAIIMDEEGPDWCKQNIGFIVSQMKEEAERRQTLFIEWGAKVLVKIAIRNTRYKLRLLGD